MYRKALAGRLKVVDFHEPRMCAVSISTTNGPMLLVNVYMPTDSSDDASYDEYVDICTKVITVFLDSDAVSLIVAGDFNCRTDTRFYRIFTRVLSEYELTCVDLSLLQKCGYFC